MEIRRVLAADKITEWQIGADILPQRLAIAEKNGGGRAGQQDKAEQHHRQRHGEIREHTNAAIEPAHH